MSPPDLRSNRQDSGARQLEMRCRTPSLDSAAEPGSGAAAKSGRSEERLCFLIAGMATLLVCVLKMELSCAALDLGSEDCGAQKLSLPQLCKDLVGLDKGECRRLGPDASLRDNFEEIQPVLACQIGNRHQLSFFPKNIVRKAGDVAHVDARAYHPAALSHRTQRRRHQFPGGGVDDGGVERSVRQLARRSGPPRPEPTGKILRRDVTGSREGINRPALP